MDTSPLTDTLRQHRSLQRKATAVERSGLPVRQRSSGRPRTELSGGRDQQLGQGYRLPGREDQPAGRVGVTEHVDVGP